jgi:toxin YoeB
MFTPKYTKRFRKEFERFRKYDKEITAKIKVLIADALEHPIEGLGRPERLWHGKGNWCSRRIDQKNRLVYKIVGNVIWFEQCEGHYGHH